MILSGGSMEACVSDTGLLNTNSIRRWQDPHSPTVTAVQL